MRNSLLSLILVGTLVLAVPAFALAQEAQSVQAPQAQDQGLAGAAAPAQEPAERPGATVDPGQAQATPAQTETTPEEETPTGDEGDTGVPQQYTDPLAGQDDGQTSQQQQPAETAPSATGVQSVSAGTGSQLPSTGATAGLLAIGGAALLAAGLAMRLLCRDSAYPYPYRRY